MSVIEIIRARADAFASLPAVIEAGHSWTHSELWIRVDRLSGALHGFGLRPGNVLLAWLPNRHEMIEAELAALQSGLVWVAVNARFTATEAADIIKDCEPRLIITDPGHQAAVLDAFRICGLESGSIRIITTGPPYEKLLEDAPSTRPAHKPSPGDVARLRYTSGTTGKPKAAILPHRVYEASLRNLEHELHPLCSDDRVLHAAPLTHASGALVFPVLAAGGANVIEAHMTAAETLATIERERITTMFVVPTMLQRMVEAPEFGRYDHSSLKTIMYGGAPTPPGKLEPAVKALGSVLVHIFGMTEAPYPITTLAREEHRPGNPKLGSIGRPSSICELEIRSETGEILDAGEVGEVWVKGPNVMQGYWRDEAETLRVLREGWLATGDLGRRDAEGFYWIVDRKKDVIITGGFNVYATEVEAVLCSHPEVREAAVIGHPDSDWGEMVAAHVVLKPDAAADEEQLRQWCRERLSNYKQPRRYIFTTDLPRNPAGKIHKQALREAIHTPQAAMR